MPSAADIAEKAAEYAASTAAGAAGAPARIITTILKFADSSHEKSVRDKARQLLNCPHIVICPHGTFNTRQVDMIDYVKETMGMAFVYESIALGHRQSDLSVKALSTQTIRYTRGEDGKPSWTDSPRQNTMSCDFCMRERVG